MDDRRDSPRGSFYNTRAAAGVSAIHLRVFVLPRPV